VSITVMMWNYVGSKSAFGHASLSVDGGEPSGNWYISWWPNCPPGGSDAASFWEAQRREYFGLCEPKRSRKLSDDISAENGPPDHHVLVLGLDETAVKAFWADLTTDPRAQWSATTTNCAAAVAAALSAGGSDNYIGFVESLWFDVFHTNCWSWTPKSVFDYAVLLAQKLRDAGKMP